MEINIFDPKTAWKSSQNQSKTTPRGDLFALKFASRFWIVFCFVFGRFGAPKWSPYCATKLEVPPLPWGPKPVIWSSWCGSSFDLRSGIVLEPSSAFLEITFGRSWSHARPSWGQCLLRGCRFDAFFFLLLFEFGVSIFVFRHQ